MDNIINPHIIQKILNRNAVKLSGLDFILKELAHRVMSRLDYIKIQPEIILDCGSGLGFDYQLLAEKYTSAKIVELDFAIELLKQHNQKTGLFSGILNKKNKRSPLCADATHIPLANGQVNFAYANLLLPYLSDIQAFIKELRRILKVGSTFCISGLGVDSFKELRELGLSTFKFPDMHDIGDMLLGAGFSNPVVDMEHITLEYDDLNTLISDIQLIGAGAALNPDYLTRDVFNRLQKKRDEPIKLTLEIFIAHGWKEQDKIDLPEGFSPITFKSKH